MTELTPFINIGPGDVIKDEMEFYGWSQKDLAEILGVSEKHVSLLLNNKSPITANLALHLSSAFEQSPEFWINLDTNFRKQKEISIQYKQTEERALIFKYMPIRDMQKKGWLSKGKDKLVEEVIKYWGIKTLDLNFLEKRVAKACFKTSEKLSSRFNAYFAQTWIQKVDIEARKQEGVPKYTKAKLQALAKRIPLYTVDNNIEKFLQDLKDTGVVFMVVKNLEKTFTDGAAYWVNENPVIALTGRFSRNDNFWFTMAHEIGHVLKHSRKLKDPIFIDSMDHEELVNRPEEQEANDFAHEVLKYDQIRHFFKGMARISRLRVLECAHIQQIHEGIIVGYLQFNKMLSFRNLNQLKINVKEILEKYQVE